MSATHGPVLDRIIARIYNWSLQFDGLCYINELYQSVTVTAQSSITTINW